ncbi:acyl-CoA dehydrogenase family protein [Micromonospora sp. STR1s_5]|nr:acyl-CoA dehydrogenase family protein [Micromonospora sp. STR1s_5]
MIPSETASAINMIRESARGIVKSGDLKRVRDLRFKGSGFSQETWTEMCQLGWPALRVAEDEGGIGLGALPYCALAEELGRGLVPEPLIPAIVAAALLTGDELTRHLAGERLVIPAWQDARDSLLPTAPLQLQDGKVTATKLYVPSAESADAFLVLGPRDAVLVPADAPGVSVEPVATQDGGSLATIRFEAASGTAFEANPGPALAEAALASAAYLLGVMDAALEITVAYLKTRVQFGKPIGTFQVLQHMAVDLKCEVEVTRASIEAAAVELDREGHTRNSEASISRAKARVSTAALKVTRDCIQLHGGIGFTEEHDIGLFLRKAMVVAAQFGSAGRHRANFARLKPAREFA